MTAVPGCLSGAGHDVPIQQETLEKMGRAALSSCGNVYAVPAHAAKKHAAGPSSSNRAGLIQTEPVVFSHVMPGCWNKSILQPVIGLPPEEHVIGTENPST
jgi:hypothetical protein